MLVNSITIGPGAEIKDAHIESGDAFPASPNIGRLFYLSTTIDEFTPIGLYVYDGITWHTNGTGPTGPTGPTGAAGLNGADGAIGPTGPAGADGLNGATGPAGVNGLDGTIGPTGPAGVDGLNGVDGAIGPTGPAGADGLNGATGPTGPTGINGIADVFNADHALAYTTTDILTDVNLGIAAGTQILVYSIHIANITASDDYFDCAVLFGGTDNIYFAFQVPLLANNSVELLKRPKIMSYGDSLLLKSLNSGACNITVVWHVLPDLNYINRVLLISTNNSLMDVYVADGDAIISSILVVNIDGVDNYTVDVVWTDSNDVIQAYYAKGLVIPVHSGIELCEGVKYIPMGYKLKASSLFANKINIYISGKLAITP